jgi:DNA-binding CsgD family transcriptional regulator
MTDNDQHPDLPPLSQREAAIVRLLPYGFGDKEIGAKLGLATDSVKSHLRRINLKWGTTGRVQIIVTAYQYGVLTLPEAPVRDANGATNARLWACIDSIRDAMGLPRLEQADAETLLASTESGVRQIVRANHLLSSSREAKPSGGVAHVG